MIFIRDQCMSVIFMLYYVYACHYNKYILTYGTRPNTINQWFINHWFQWEYLAFRVVKFFLNFRRIFPLPAT